MPFPGAIYLSIPLESHSGLSACKKKSICFSAGPDSSTATNPKFNKNFQGQRETPLDIDFDQAEGYFFELGDVAQVGSPEQAQLTGTPSLTFLYSHRPTLTPLSIGLDRGPLPTPPLTHSINHFRFLDRMVYFSDGKTNSPYFSFLFPRIRIQAGSIPLNRVRGAILLNELIDRILRALEMDSLANPGTDFSWLSS